MMSSTLTVRPVSARPAALGESPVWDSVRGCLWWIDGVAGEIRCQTPEGDAPAIAIGEHIGSIALAEEGGLVVALEHRVILLDPETGARSTVIALDDADPNMRLNDGKLDRQGRFVIAGMGRGGDPLGALHQVDGENRVREIARGLRIGNGVCFSPDGGTLYYADTPARKVWACDYDPTCGETGVPFLHIDTAPYGSGVDGATVDAEGNLWVALIRSSHIACFDPHGRLVQKIPSPTDLPSSLAFGGPDMSTLFVTSIRDSGTGRAVSTHPDGGQVFAFDGLGARGIEEARFPRFKVTE